MAGLAGPAGRPLKLTSGWEVLDTWSAGVTTQAERNIVYKVLLTVVDRTVFARYVVLNDAKKPAEFFVLAGCGLTVKLRADGPESFGIVYIGPARTAPGRDWTVPDQAELAG
jgi:hypothetical protein